MARMDQERVAQRLNIYDVMLNAIDTITRDEINAALQLYKPMPPQRALKRAMGRIQYFKTHGLLQPTSTPCVYRVNHRLVQRMRDTIEDTHY